MELEKFDTDFIYYTELIKSDNNFAYARYADGEVQLMKGNSIGYNSQAFMVDKWISPDGMTSIGVQLLESLNHLEENYHYAISGKNDNIMDYNFLTERISNTNLTFTNLWINANYQKMKNFYEQFDGEVYLICNHTAKSENFPFKVLEIFPFPDNCIYYFMEYGEDYINQLIDYIMNLQNKTFFISAGPISEILIHNMYNHNPNNKYIDVGSSLDEFIHGKLTRPYMNPYSQYANQKSSF